MSMADSLIMMITDRWWSFFKFNDVINSSHNLYRSDAATINLHRNLRTIICRRRMMIIWSWFNHDEHNQNHMYDAHDDHDNEGACNVDHKWIFKRELRCFSGSTRSNPLKIQLQLYQHLCRHLCLAICVTICEENMTRHDQSTNLGNLNQVYFDLK